MKTMKRLGWGSGVGAVMALVSGGLAACGSDFSNDCRETRTCAVTDDSQGGENAGGAATGDAGAQSKGAGEGGGGANGTDASAGASADAGAGGAGCDQGLGCFNEPPTVIAITPSYKESGIDPDSTIVIELSEPLDEATVTVNNIQLLDGDVPVPGQLSYADSTITFTPEKPLEFLVSYEVKVSTGVTDVEGAGLEEAFGSSFTVRDGVWSVNSIVPGTITTAPHELMLNRDGEALVTWIGTGEGTCPATARWYLRGEPMGIANTFNYERNTFCTDVHSAVSPNGFALLSWYEEDNQGQDVATAEFRAGKWGVSTQRSQRYDNYNTAVAAADDGSMHYFGAGSDVQVWRTTPAGVWSKQPQTLSGPTPLAAPSVAVAKNGDALAAWVDSDSGAHMRILVSSYSSSAQVWSSVDVLPGSTSNVVNGNDRGAPSVAFDDENQPLVIWQRGSELVATRFDRSQSIWGGFVNIAGGVTPLVKGHAEPFPLVFDGRTFVAAYTTTEELPTGILATRIHTVHYDHDVGGWVQSEDMSDAQTKPVARLPRLGADAHGNRLLVWASLVKKDVYTFSYRRFDAAAGAWLGPKPIDDVTINSAYFVSSRSRFPLGVSANGLAALAFYEETAVSQSKLQLASFY